MTDSFYQSIGKKTVATIGAIVVAAVFLMRDEARKWIGLK